MMKRTTKLILLLAVTAICASDPMEELQKDIELASAPAKELATKAAEAVTAA